MRRKSDAAQNYLERVPIRCADIGWTTENGAVTLSIENRGVFNRLLQKLLKKPKTSYIHLDERGSFVWTIIDGKSDIGALGEKVEKRFGESVKPLYERLARYFGILESYSFIEWK